MVARSVASSDRVAARFDDCSVGGVTRRGLATRRFVGEAALDSTSTPNPKVCRPAAWATNGDNGVAAAWSELLFPRTPGERGEPPLPPSSIKRSLCLCSAAWRRIRACSAASRAAFSRAACALACTAPLARWLRFSNGTGRRSTPSSSGVWAAPCVTTDAAGAPEVPGVPGECTRCTAINALALAAALPPPSAWSASASSASACAPLCVRRRNRSASIRASSTFDRCRGVASSSVSAQASPT